MTPYHSGKLCLLHMQERVFPKKNANLELPKSDAIVQARDLIEFSDITAHLPVTFHSEQLAGRPTEQRDREPE